MSPNENVTEYGHTFEGEANNEDLSFAEKNSGKENRLTWIARTR